MAVAHDAILSAGWENRGLLMYKVQSATLLVDAASLADMARAFWADREHILAAAGDAILSLQMSTGVTGSP